MSEVKKQSNVMEYNTDDGVKIKLTPEIIHKYITQSNPLITAEELMLFMMVCQSTKLNPFVRDAYLVKYDSNKPAQIVTGKDFFVKRANKNPHCRYYNAGIITVNKETGKETYQTGTYYNDKSETLDGAWAITFRDDKTKPFKITVKYNEYSSGQSTWKKMPATMIRKVALVQVLREAYPEDFKGLYSAEEILDDVEKLDTKNIDIEQVLQEEFPVNNNNDFVDAEFEEVPEEKEGKEEKTKPQSTLLDEKISLEKAQNLYIMAKGHKDLAKEIVKKYGYESSKDILLKDYSLIANEILESIKEINKEPNNLKDALSDTHAKHHGI